jgi:MFS family permease
MADILPRRTVFLVSLAGFTMASLASGCANNGTGLVGTRALQGAAAALLAPSALSLVMATYGGEERKRGPITDEEPTAAIDEAGYELA